LRIVQRRGRATGTTYALTDRGLELWPAVYALAQWENSSSPPKAPAG
jgi:DNA-binding HxlR family transcriptional regulator